MRVATPPRLPDEPRSAPRSTPDTARARYSRAPAAGRLTLRTTACGLFDSRRTAHPPHLAVGGPHAVVPNLVSTPPTPLAGFEVSTEVRGSRRPRPLARGGPHGRSRAPGGGPGRRSALRWGGARGRAGVEAT